jgi:hypothetical protein
MKIIFNKIICTKKLFGYFVLKSMFSYKRNKGKGKNVRKICFEMVDCKGVNCVIVINTVQLQEQIFLRIVCVFHLSILILSSCLHTECHAIP